MPVLDRLYQLEIEFHRLFRGFNAFEAASVHTSHALQNNYEPMLRSVGLVDPAELARTAGRMQGDPRDVQAALQSLRRFLRVE